MIKPEILSPLKDQKSGMMMAWSLMNKDVLVCDSRKLSQNDWRDIIDYASTARSMVMPRIKNDEVGALIPADLFYAFHTFFDAVDAYPAKHIEIDDFVRDQKNWISDDFVSLGSSHGYGGLKISLILLNQGEPVAAFVPRPFFPAYMKVIEDSRVEFYAGIKGEMYQPCEDYFKIDPVLEHHHEYYAPPMSVRDRAHLLSVISQLRDLENPNEESVRKAVSALKIDLNQTPSLPVYEQESPSEQQTPPALITEQSKPKTLQGEFEAVVNTKGYVRLPPEWHDLVDRDYISLFNQGTGQLVCFNESVVDDDVMEVVRGSEISNHLFAFMQSPIKLQDGRTKIDKEAQDTFRCALNIGSSAKIPVKLTGCSNYFTVEAVGLSDSSENSEIGKWRRLDVSVAQFTQALDAKARSSGPEQSR